MNRYPRVVAALFLLSCASASAKDFYITAFGGDYETVYAVSPESIVDLGDGVKRADLLAVGITRIEMEQHARFICQWPEIKELTGLVKLPAESDWDFVNSVTDTVDRIKNK